MESKRGISKIALVIIILVIVLLIAAIAGGIIWYIQSNSTELSQEDIQLYDDYTEGEGFIDEDVVVKEMTSLASGLQEYRSDERGVRFGYLDGMNLPTDTEKEDGTFISTIESSSKSTVIQLRIGKIDTSQDDIDHVQKQKEALIQELIEAETYTYEVEEGNEIVEYTYVPTADEVSDISISYVIFGDQLAVKFTYTENDLMATRVLTIKGDLVYSLTYKAEEDEYSYTEEDKVMNSFEFIDKLDDVEATELNTVTINGVEYTLPIKVARISDISIDSKYIYQSIQPNYFTIVSLYESQSPKYSAYIYNATASVGKIGDGYVTAISTDINRGGNITIYKGIEIGTSYSEVQELLGSPSKQYYTEDKTTLTNIYQIEDVTIQLKFMNDDLSKPDENSTVVAILVKVAV